MTTGRTTAIRTVSLGLALALGLTGCGPGDLPGSATPRATPTVTVDAPVPDGRDGPPQPDEPPVWPLTGVGTKKPGARPAVSVKIENSVDARPQRGLVGADIVWEEVVEGGITRFVATYHSTIPDVVEPVRSVRPMDPAIVAPLGGLLAFSGGKGGYIDAVRRSGTQVVVMDDGDSGFSRDPGRVAPHNVIGSVPTFLQQADKKRAVPPPAQFEYARTVGEGSAPQVGKRAGAVDVRLSPAQRTVWTWAPKQKRYLRSEGTSASVAADGRRHAARNVLVLSTRVVNTSSVDASGAPVPETLLAGEKGRGTLVSSGRGVPVRWSKKNLKAPIVLTTPGGKDVELDPGNTWIELVPRGKGSWSVR